MCLNVKSDYQKSSAWLKVYLGRSKYRAMRRILGFGVFKITHKNFSGTIQGVRGHAPLENFENGGSQIG